jgi:hypothetical protein
LIARKPVRDARFKIIDQAGLGELSEGCKIQVVGNMSMQIGIESETRRSISAFKKLGFSELVSAQCKSVKRKLGINLKIRLPRLTIGSGGSPLPKSRDAIRVIQLGRVVYCDNSHQPSLSSVSLGAIS